MTILAISGSLRKASYNTSLIQNIQKLGSKENTITIYQGLGSLPHFNADLDNHTLEEDTSPIEVQKFRRLVKNADALVISTPEYAFQLPGVLKNALDWLVSSQVIIQKPVVIISASTSAMGGNKAYEQLNDLMGVISEKVVKTAGFQVAKVNKKINTNGKITDKALISDLKKALIKLDKYLNDELA